MSLRLEIVSRHRQSLGERGIKQFGQAGGTIGRSLESDWVLPDGQRFLSSRHASIDFRSGSYYIIDTSTNGVYINGSDEPVGRGNPQRLFTGDRIRIGDYEIVVEVTDMDNTRETLVGTGHVDPVDIRQRVDSPDPTSHDLVDAFEITGVGIEMLLEEDEAETLSPLSYKFKTDDLELEPEAPKPAAKTRGRTKSQKSGSGSKPKVTAKSASSARHSQSSAGANESQARPAGTSSGKSSADRGGASSANERSAGGNSVAGLDAFFRGAGLPAKTLSAAETEQVLHRLGQIMREMIVGIIDSLHMRSLQKAELKQANTTIQARDNNVLKFSASVEEAFERLLFEDSDQYLRPVESVRTAFGDLKQHQRSMLTGLNRAITDYVARFDPEHLEDKFSNGKRGSIMGAASKLKYWDLYKDLYLVLSQQASGELPQVFLEELSRAYEHEATKAAPKTSQPAAKRKAS